LATAKRPTRRNKRICVFCGSAFGERPAYRAAAKEVGRLLAEKGIGLVYGGASVGLMGAVADAALSAGGEVIGVIPKSLVDRELAHPGLTKLHVVPTMHARKAMMAELSDAFLALPGGLGTFEEFFETWTWNILGLQRKAFGLLNTEGYYAPLIAALDHAEREGFIKRKYRALMHVADHPTDLVKRLIAAAAAARGRSSLNKT